MGNSIQFAGHIISDGGIRPDDDKFAALREFKKLANVKEMRLFLGLVAQWQGQNDKRKTYIGHLKYWSYKLQEIEIEIDENDRISDLIWHKLYTINVDSFMTNTLPIQSQLNIYTVNQTGRHCGRATGNRL